jgi:hypothetical protein
MSQPLRSTPITGASSLLRAGPPARPHRYSTPRSFRCLAHSLSHPPPCGERALYRHTLSHVSCSSRRSDSRRLHAGHRLANKRAPARLFPGLCTHPGFDAISYFSTLPQRFARARLPDPRLTALKPPFSSIAPHNGLQPMQHRGGLTPPPAGRRRRATKPSSTTQHCLKKVYLHPTPLRRSWHTCMNKLASNGEIGDP